MHEHRVQLVHGHRGRRPSQTHERCHVEVQWEVKGARDLGARIRSNVVTETLEL